MFNKLFVGLAVSVCSISGYIYYMYKKTDINHNINEGIIYFIESGTGSKYEDHKLIKQEDPFNNPMKYCKLIKTVPSDIHIKLILSTHGGDANGADLILRTLKNHAAGYTAYISDLSFSAGSLLALGAKEIVMTKNSLLSKIDFMFKLDNHKYMANDLIKINENYIDSKNIQQIIYSKNGFNYLSELLNIALNGSTTYRDIIEKNFIYSETLHMKKFNISDCLTLGLNVRYPNDDELIFF
jgi:hypothetical protein